MAATSSGALRALSREERYAGGVSDLMNCLDEQLRPEPRLCWDFETLQAHLQQQRRRQAERVLARRLESLRAVSQAQASLGRFLDRRTSSVQEASCAASDAQGRLNRLQEQSQTVRVSALKRAQASLADAEQRALQEARARHLLLDQREQELATLLKLSGSLRSKSKATAENLTRMRETLEAAQRQASDVLEEKSYMEERRVQIEAREASLPVMERAWKEVVAQVGRDPKKRPALLAMAIEHISNELLKDQRYISCFTALEQKVSSDDRRGENPPLRRVVREAASERRRTPRRSTPCQEVPAPVSAASETLEDDLEVELEVEVDSPADVDGDGEVIWTPRESVTAVPGSVVGSAALERMGASKTQEEDQVNHGTATEAAPLAAIKRKWASVGADDTLQQMLVDARHAASALAFPPGAGPGLGAPPVAAPAVGAIQAEAGDQVWVRIETDGDKHRGEVVTLTGGEIIHGNVGLKMEGTTHFAIRRMLRADVEAFKGKEASADARLLGISFQGIVIHERTWRDVSKELSEEEFRDWGVPGPRTSAWCTRFLNRRNGGPNYHHRWWVNNHNLKHDSWGVSEHEHLMKVLDKLGRFDGLDLSNLAGAELAFRRLQLIEYYYSDRGPGSGNKGAGEGDKKKEDDLVYKMESAIFSGSHKEFGDVMVCPTLMDYVSKEIETEASIMKQVRKAREERAAASK
ncbi:Uncharacterized protein SCF082_LOCUS44843 [Durusdinium trenchii]|uniref:Uncharacterized protein n=1 Tax=Durusdinium trenchii TaxID=1381693 RepID=A0ABP0R5Q6_9DINO